GLAHFHRLEHFRSAGKAFASLADAALQYRLGMRAAGKVFHFEGGDLARCDAAQQCGKQLTDLVDVVGLAPRLRSAATGAGSKPRSKRIGGNLLPTGAMQGDPEITEFQDPFGRDEYVPGRDVAMDSAAFVDAGDGTQQSDDLAARSGLRPRLRIALQIAA